MRIERLKTLTVAAITLAGSSLWSADAPVQTAWDILQNAAVDKSTDKRANEARALGLITRDPKATAMAEKALEDQKTDVRVAAAAALGEMDARGSISKLRKALSDNDPKVVLAAARSLVQLHDDPPAYEVFYAVLTGQQKAGQGLVATQLQSLQNPKNLAELGVGFVPFGGVGLFAYNAFTKDDVARVRAAAANALAKDPDRETATALVQAVSDKSWEVRVGALQAIAKRGDPALLQSIKGAMSDDKDIVSYTASAAVIRLTNLQRGSQPEEKKNKRQTNARACRSNGVVALGLTEYGTVTYYVCTTETRSDARSLLLVVSNSASEAVLMAWPR
jgi:HEAT repeat protein